MQMNEMVAMQSEAMMQMMDPNQEMDTDLA